MLARINSNWHLYLKKIPFITTFSQQVLICAKKIMHLHEYNEECLDFESEKIQNVLRAVT